MSASLGSLAVAIGDCRQALEQALDNASAMRDLENLN